VDCELSRFCKMARRSKVVGPRCRKWLKLPKLQKLSLHVEKQESIYNAAGACVVTVATCVNETGPLIIRGSLRFLAKLEISLQFRTQALSFQNSLHSLYFFRLRYFWKHFALLQLLPCCNKTIADTFWCMHQITMKTSLPEKYKQSFEIFVLSA